MKEDVLPEGWVKTTLEYLGKWGSGGTPNRKYKEYYEGDISWVKTGDLGEKYLFKSSEYISKLGLKNSSAKMFPKGAIVLAMYGATIGKVSILDIEASTNQACAVIIPNENIDTEFLYYFLLSQKDIFIKKGKGGAQPNISQAIIKEHDINLPPLPEQQYLSQKLTALLDEVAQTKQRLEAIPALLKQFRQSVLTDAVSGRLINNKFIKNNLLKDSVDILNGARKPISSTERKKIQGNIPYYGATGIVDYLNDFTHDGRFLLVGEDGANLLTKAKDLAYIVEGKVWVNNHAHVLKEKPSYCLNFIKIVINSLDLSAWVTGTAQPKLTKKALESLPIPHASLEQQTQIVQKVETYFALADEIETQVKTALKNVNLLTQSILAKAFNGELSAAWRNSQVTETQGNV